MCGQGACLTRGRWAGTASGDLGGAPVGGGLGVVRARSGELRGQQQGSGATFSFEGFAEF